MGRYDRPLALVPDAGRRRARRLPSQRAAEKALDSQPRITFPVRCSSKMFVTTIDRLAPVCQCHTPTLNKTGNFLMASSVLSVRLSDQERTLLEAASSYARTNVSDFVRRKALEAAEIDMVERRIVTIPAKDWARFEAWAASPPREITGLKDLARKSPTWRK